MHARSPRAGLTCSYGPCSRVRTVLWGHSPQKWDCVLLVLGVCPSPMAAAAAIGLAEHVSAPVLSCDHISSEPIGSRPEQHDRIVQELGPSLLESNLNCPGVWVLALLSTACASHCLSRTRTYSTWYRNPARTAFGDTNTHNDLSPMGNVISDVRIHGALARRHCVWNLNRLRPMATNRRCLDMQSASRSRTTNDW